MIHLQLDDGAKHALLLEALDVCGPAVLIGLEEARDAILYAATRTEPGLLRSMQALLDPALLGEEEEDEDEVEVEEGEEGDDDDDDDEQEDEEDDAAVHDAAAEADDGDSVPFELYAAAASGRAAGATAGPIAASRLWRSAQTAPGYEMGLEPAAGASAHLVGAISRGATRQSSGSGGGLWPPSHAASGQVFKGEARDGGGEDTGMGLL
jgi:hypothetical protein